MKKSWESTKQYRVDPWISLCKANKFIDHHTDVVDAFMMRIYN